MFVVTTLIEEKEEKPKNKKGGVEFELQGQTRPTPLGVLELEWPIRVVTSWAEMPGFLFPHFSLDMGCCWRLSANLTPSS